MREMTRVSIACLVGALVLASLSGCGIVSAVEPNRPTLPPVQAPSIITATPRTTRAAAQSTAAAGTGTQEAVPQKMVVSADGDGVYIRSKPDMAAKVRAWPDGTEMIILGKEGDWYRVRAPNGYQGYMPVRYLKPVPGSTPAPSGAKPATAAPGGP